MTDELKVLHILAELRSSGAEVMMKIAAERWRQLGVRAEILATGASVGPFAQELEHVGYPIHHIAFRKHPGFFREVHRLVRAGGYDVVHVHTEQAFLWLGLTVRLAGARPVQTVHNNFQFTGNLRLRRTLQRWFARRIGTRFVSVGESVRMNEEVRFRNATIEIENWIDIDRFVPPAEGERERCRKLFGVSDDDLVLVTVGNCSSIKNHRSLLSAIAAQEVPPVWLHVGQEQIDEPERALAADLGVSERCRFLGRVDPREAMYAADLFVMPSLYEGLSIATAEALATGLPGLLTDVPGSRDLRSIDVAITWSGTRPDELAEALHKALSMNVATFDPEERSAQHNHVAAVYSAARGVPAYVDVYRATI